MALAACQTDHVAAAAAAAAAVAVAVVVAVAVEIVVVVMGQRMDPSLVREAVHD